MCVLHRLAIRNMGEERKGKKEITSGKRVHINHAPREEEGRGRSLLEGGGGGQVESEVFRGSVGSDTLLEAFMKKQGYDNRAPTPGSSRRSFNTSPHCCFIQSATEEVSWQVKCCYTKKKACSGIPDKL